MLNKFLISAIFSTALFKENVCLLLVKVGKPKGSTNHFERFLPYINTERTSLLTHGYAHEQNENLNIFIEQNVLNQQQSKN